MILEEPWRIELLGGLRARCAGRVVTRFRTQKTASLLAYLAYYRGRSHPRELLAEMLWPDSEPEVGRHSLRVALSSLRQALEPPGAPPGTVICANRFAVSLNPDAATTDVAEFEAKIRLADQAHSRTGRVRLLEDAAELYQGELLTGFFDDWVGPEQRRLAELYVQAIRQLLGHLHEAGDQERGMRWAHRAIGTDPCREELHHTLMRLYLAAGEPGSALRQYRELERVLCEQLNVPPSPALRQLAREIESGEAADPANATAGEQGSQRQNGEPVRLLTPSPPHPFTPSPPLPVGTVTFLLTEIEGSTALWERASDAFREALRDHHALLRREFLRHRGREVKETGDSFLVAFEGAGDAVACAAACQRALAAHPWPKPIGVPRVRMALHTGEVARYGSEYRGLAIQQASRLMGATHAGQILCTAATASLLQGGEPDLCLADLGLYRLRDAAEPERLFQVNPSGLPQPEFPHPRAEPGCAGSVPLCLTRFFGREQELATLAAMLTPAPVQPRTHSGVHARLVTLTGAGGTGKTRLALEMARRLMQAFSGAVWFVPLESLADTTLIPGAILDAMRLPHTPGRDSLAQLLHALSRQPSLLVLDNLEHLVEGASDLVCQLLGSAPGLVCLATSRRLLGIPGEQEFPILPLPMPVIGDPPERLAACDTVRLFIDRAQAARPGFQVTLHNTAAVAELCCRLEGLPLALELAAARMSVLSPAQMLSQIAKRFDLLAGRKRGVVERHQTLRAAMEWSYCLLSPELQDLFARLSVFRGGCSVQAALQACGASLSRASDEAPVEASRAQDGSRMLDLLQELRECSMVMAGDCDACGEVRFRMLETVREFAAERLHAAPGRGDPIHRRHAEYFLCLAQGCVRALRTPRDAAAFRQFQMDLDNIRAAMDWALSAGESELSAELALALGIFLQRCGFQKEAIERVRAGLAVVSKDAPACLSDGSPVAPFSRVRAELLREQAGLYLDQFRWEEASRCAAESLALFEPLRMASEQAYALNILGLAARGQKEFQAARGHLSRALAHFEGIGDRAGIAIVRNNLGLVEYEDEEGSPSRAEEHWQDALRLYRESGDARGTAEALTNLGVLAQVQGDLARARECYAEVLSLEKDLERVFGVARALCNLGEVAQAEGAQECAYRLFAAAEALFDRLGSPYQDYARQLCLDTRAALGSGDADPERQVRALRSAPLDRVIEWSLGCHGVME